MDIKKIKKMGELCICKKFEFCYAHSLPDYNGKCVNIHGHTGFLHVEINSNVNPNYKYPGMIMDFKELKTVVEQVVIKKLDHGYLNERIPFFKENPPTAENITLWIVNELRKVFGPGLICVRVYETPDSYAEWVAMP